MIPAIEVTDLTYRYADGRLALQNVSFTVAEQECVGVIGPNGAGKSTLLLHLNGLLGTNGVQIRGETDLMKRRRLVGLLFQDPDDQLFCSTVAEDVAFGPRQLGLDGIQTRVTRALGQVGLAGFEDRVPQHLSHGEKRRVCLAGILACEPAVLVLDEPTSDLDPRGRRELKALLRRIPATKVIATHDLELVVELCSRVVVLDGGRQVQAGNTLEVLGNEPLMLAHGLERPHILLHRHGQEHIL